MERHCHLGAQLLKSKLTDTFAFIEEEEEAEGDNGLLELSAKIALTHHERWDGTGYPDGLRDEEIPIEGCIVAVADVYDALRSTRPYKQPFSSQTALQRMIEGKGSHFNPTVVEALERRHDDVEEIIDRHGNPEEKPFDAAA